MYGVAGFGVTESRVNAGGGGGTGACGATLVVIWDWNDGGGANAGRTELAALSLVPHSSQYSEPSKLSVPQ